MEHVDGLALLTAIARRHSINVPLISHGEGVPVLVACSESL